jgi:5-dehydro-4-deoxyglucarate dehydratase
MSAAAGELLKRRVSEGIIAFPATPFRAGGVDSKLFERHVADLVAAGPTAVVPAGGAGEVFSLNLAEQEALVRAAVGAGDGVPVIAGAGQGVALATEFARSAERAGAAAVLIFPPYLITPEQDGLAAYIETVCKAVGISVIAYSRDNGVLAPDTVLRLADRLPNLIAVKDGTGDFESLMTLRQRAGDRIALINGVPTAETIALQCFAMGIRSYTSAIFTFLPALATAFYRALRDADRTFVDLVLDQFVMPLAAIRRRKRGYAVSIVKAGLDIVGKPMGPVRPPLIDLSRADRDDLAALIDRAGGILAGKVARVSPARATG